MKITVFMVQLALGKTAQQHFTFLFEIIHQFTDHTAIISST